MHVYYIYIIYVHVHLHVYMNICQASFQLSTSKQNMNWKLGHLEATMKSVHFMLDTVLAVDSSLLSRARGTPWPIP